MNKYLLLISCLFALHFVSAQSLTINSYVNILEASPEGAKVIISKNGNIIDEKVLTKKGRCDLKLAFDADYKLIFEKSGYISKTVSINTEVPEEILESNPNFPPLTLRINLFPMVKNIDLSVFEQPVGILNYHQEIDDFKFDDDYSQKIKPRMDQAEQKIRQYLATQGAAALEEERKFAELVNKGQQAFNHKEWSKAIDLWSQALTLRPQNEDIKPKIETARKEIELAEAQKSIELQNEKAYQLLISSADAMLDAKKYQDAKEKYLSATKLNSKDPYPNNKIREIETILASIAKEKAEQERQLAASEASYEKAILTADQAFNDKEYDKAITIYRQALEIKKEEAYPRERISKAEAALAEIRKQELAAAEKQRLEEERKNSLKNKYAELIAEADQAFKNENYSLAKLRYTEADNLNLGEEYPKKQLLAIENIINSAKYKAKLAEYNKNKTLAEKNMTQKDYAAAKVYYQKALSILSIDQDAINQQIAEIDKLIEAARLAETEKAYQTNIEKADKAYQEKAFAVAKFYYKKALEIKIFDKYAKERLEEVEKKIGERQAKEAEL